MRPSSYSHVHISSDVIATIYHATRSSIVAMSFLFPFIILIFHSSLLHELLTRDAELTTQQLLKRNNKKKKRKGKIERTIKRKRQKMEIDVNGIYRDFFYVLSTYRLDNTYVTRLRKRTRRTRTRASRTRMALVRHAIATSLVR